MIKYHSNNERTLGWVYRPTLNKRSEKQWFRFKEGGGGGGEEANPSFWPDMLAKMA